VLAGRKAGNIRPAKLIRIGFALCAIGLVSLVPLVPQATSGWWLVIPLMITGAGLGLLVSQLNNYTLAPIEEERVSEAAGVNSAAGSFGLSFGLAMTGGILLATLSIAFTSLTEDSKVIPVAQQQQIANKLEDDAEVVSNTQIAAVAAKEPQAVQDEITRINTEANDRALQVALAIPILATLLGLLGAFRMIRLRDIEPAAPPSEAAAPA
jgi:MFS family permease